MFLTVVTTPSLGLSAPSRYGKQDLSYTSYSRSGAVTLAFEKAIVFF